MHVIRLSQGTERTRANRNENGGRTLGGSDVESVRVHQLEQMFRSGEGMPMGEAVGVWRDGPVGTLIVPQFCCESKLLKKIKPIFKKAMTSQNVINDNRNFIIFFFERERFQELNIFPSERPPACLP